MQAHWASVICLFSGLFTKMFPQESAYDQRPLVFVLPINFGGLFIAVLPPLAQLSPTDMSKAVLLASVGVSQGLWQHSFKQRYSIWNNVCKIQSCGIRILHLHSFSRATIILTVNMKRQLQRWLLTAIRKGKISQLSIFKAPTIHRNSLLFNKSS